MKNEYDFSDGKRGAVVKSNNKERITIRLDEPVVGWFKEQTEEGGSYQALINDVLRAHVERQGEPLEDMLRRVVHEELELAG